MFGICSNGVYSSHIPRSKWTNPYQLEPLQGKRYKMVLHNDGQIGMERGVHRYEDVNGHAADAEFPFSEVLKHELHYRERIVLCLRLVRSLLDLHNTTWLRGDWGVEDIWVYGKSSSSELQLRQPYLRLVLPSNQSDSPVDSQPSTTSDFFDDMHRFPHALSLGVVLMQILLSDRLQNVASLEDYRNERRRHLSEDIRNDVNLKVVQAGRLLEECQKRFSARSPLIKAISGCTKPNLFGPLRERERGREFSSRGFGWAVRKRCKTVLLGIFKGAVRYGRVVGERYTGCKCFNFDVE